MRSVSVVLPESMWALIPMLRILARSNMAGPLAGPSTGALRGDLPAGAPGLFRLAGGECRVPGTRPRSAARFRQADPGSLDIARICQARPRGDWRRRDRAP